MFRPTTKRAPLGAALAAAIITSAGLASTASATSIAVNGSKLYVSAEPGDTNNIKVSDVAGFPGRVKITETGTGAQPLYGVVGGGGYTIHSYSNTEWVISGATTLKSVRVRGGDGNDQLSVFGSTLSATLVGGTGADNLQAGAPNATLLGNAGNDVLYGWTGDDTLVGGSGSDILIGDAGDDQLVTADGTGGNDSAKGDAGDDEATIDSGDTVWASVETTNVD